MKSVCTVWALVVTLLIANSVFAAGGKKKEGAKGGGVPYFQQVDRYLKPVTLTDDQKTTLDTLKKDFTPKLKEVYAKLNDLTPEQRKAGADARKAAQDAGKKGKELINAFNAAITKTDAQKKQEKEAGSQLRKLENQMHAKVLEMLTDDQKAQIKAANKKAAKPAKPAAPAAAAPAATN